MYTVFFWRTGPEDESRPTGWNEYIRYTACVRFACILYYCILYVSMHYATATGCVIELPWYWFSRANYNRMYITYPRVLIIFYLMPRMRI